MASLAAATLALAILATVHSAPSLPTVHDCKDDVFWHTGNTYKYDYEATVDSAAVGTTDKVAGVKITCGVDLGVNGQCRFTLKTHDCKLDEIPAQSTSRAFQKHPKSDEFNTLLQKYPVSFLMHEDEVDAVVAHEQEPINILNIKRGIISALMARRHHDHDHAFLHEDEIRTDVHGTCPVEYTISENHIEYDKKMNECRYPGRTDFYLSPYSMVWNMSFIEFWMVNSTAHCSYDLGKDAITKVHCHERHAMRFESSQNTQQSVQTIIHQTLKLQSTKTPAAGFGSLKGKRIAGIQFEWEPTAKPTQQDPNFLTKAKKLMADMVETTQLEIKVSTVTQFDELISLLRSSPDVAGFTNAVIGCQFKSGCSDLDKELSMSYLRDALVTCNTVACMKGVRIVASNEAHMSRNYLNVMLYAFTKLKINDPEYLSEVLEICKARSTRLCPLALTSMIHTYSTKHGHHHMPDAVKKTVDYLGKLIGDDCNPAKVQPKVPYFKAVEKMIIGLKAFGNLGHCAQHVSPTIIRRLGTCITKAGVPHNVTIEAIKAFRRMDPTPEIYTTLMNVLKNPKELKELRIVSYLVLTVHFHDMKLYEDLVKILKDETDNQLRNYVSMHMTNVLIYGTSELDKLQHSIRDVMVANPGVFEVRGTHPLTSSRHRQFARFFKVPALQDALSRFGIDVSSSAIYETFSYLPQNLILNLTTQLFGKTFNPLTMQTAIHGMEPVLESILGPNGLIKPGQIAAVKARLEKDGKSFLDFIVDPVPYMDSVYTPHFEKSIEDKLNTIHNSVHMEYGKIPHYFSSSIALYGDELAFTSLDLIKDRINNYLEHEFYEINWEEHQKYNAHRIIRMIEGSNQVPTLAGLPLYWNVEATVGLSIRAKVKADIFTLLHTDPQFAMDWDINTSGQVSFYNQMKVELPHFSEFGYQANNTFYRSRQRVGELKYEEGDLKITVQAPERPQQIINLFRTNQLIRNHHLEDLPDYQIQRVNTEKCHASEYSGLKWCRMKSFADVRNDESKPWMLLAGNAEYRVWVEKDDVGLKQYNLHLHVDKSKLPWKETTFDFNAPGTKWRREIKGTVKRNLETNEFAIQLSVPERPHFHLNAERKLKKSANSVGYVTHLDAMFVEGRPVKFHAEKSLSTVGDVTSKSLDLKLSVKGRKYTYSRKHVFSDTSRKIIMDTTFESDAPESYMHDILPDVFWETDSKAKLSFDLDVKKHYNSDDWDRSISAHIKLPKSILELSTNHEHGKDDHHTIHFNITKKSLPSNDLQSFIFFTYDKVNNVKGDHTIRTHAAKLMIPKLRWQLDIKRDYDLVDNKNYLILKREKALDDSLIVTDGSKVDERHVTLNIDHHNVSHARGQFYPAPRERTLKVKLTYPRDGKYYTVNYDGKIVNDEAQKNAIRSFHTDSNVESEFLQLKVHANTDYLRNDLKWKIDHKSDFTYIPSGKTATYKLNWDLDREKHTFDLSQTFDSSFYTFKEKARIARTGENIDIDLTISANCPTWDTLNVELEQKAQINPENSWETMKLRHKLIDIDVKAEFKLPLGLYYKKEMNIKSKTEFIPSMNWYVFHHDYKYYSIHIEYPEDKRNVYSLLEVDSNYKGAELTVTYNNEGEPNATAIDWMVRLVKPDVILANFTTDAKAIKRATARYSARLVKLREAWEKIKSDPNHPMNVLLKPIVKTTLADYLKELKERIQRRREAIRQAVYDAVVSLRPIYGTLLEVIRGIVLAFERLGQRLAQREETSQSSIVWAYNYFEVREKLKTIPKRLAERSLNRLSAMGPTTRGGAVVIEHPFHWNSFAEIPRMSPSGYRKLDRVRRIRTLLKSGGLPEFRRTAVAYGAGHMHSFDGNNFDVALFPKKCAYMMAHDFVFRHYTILAQIDAVHVLFPDIAISVDKNDKIHINNGKGDEKAPITSPNGKVTVTRDGSSVLITSTYGLNVVVIPKHLTMFASLDFWNHNRTLGILGNNDNEEGNDFKLLSGKVSKSVNNNFLLEYEVSGQGGCNKVPPPQACNGIVSDECNVLDSSNHDSPLYPCFDVIDPIPFKKACQRDTQCGMKMCSSAIAYAGLCEAQGVYASQPETCA